MPWSRLRQCLDGVRAFLGLGSDPPHAPYQRVNSGGARRHAGHNRAESVNGAAGGGDPRDGAGGAPDRSAVLDTPDLGDLEHDDAPGGAVARTPLEQLADGLKRAMDREDDAASEDEDDDDAWTDFVGSAPAEDRSRTEQEEDEEDEKKQRDVGELQITSLTVESDYGPMELQWYHRDGSDPNMVMMVTHGRQDGQAPTQGSGDERRFGFMVPIGITLKREDTDSLRQFLTWCANTFAERQDPRMRDAPSLFVGAHTEQNWGRAVSDPTGGVDPETRRLHQMFSQDVSPICDVVVFTGLTLANSVRDVFTNNTVEKTITRSVKVPLTAEERKTARGKTFRMERREEKRRVPRSEPDASWSPEMKRAWYMAQDEKIPLQDFLASIEPSIGRRPSYLMMCCRSPWPPAPSSEEMQRGPSGLYLPDFGSDEERIGGQMPLERPPPPRLPADAAPREEDEDEDGAPLY